MFDFVPKIGIVGSGVVGSAIENSYRCSNLNVFLLDKNKEKGPASYDDLRKCEGIFVCVPSPSNKNGKCDSSILEEVLDNIGKDYKGVIISKVTATPDVYQKLESIYSNLVYVPEFLTEKNSIRDYEASKKFVIGGRITAYQKEAERIIKYTHNNAEYYFCSIAEASLIKYFTNSFLAAKVVMMNEFYFLAKSYGGDWNAITDALKLDLRLGTSHMQVPGFDGQYGFGGMCFPKDLSAIIKNAEEQGVNLHILKEIVKKNTLLRLTEPK
jgi:UDPglucose 6-dehydrogenase